MRAITVNGEAITTEMIDRQTTGKAREMISQGRIQPQQLPSALPQIREQVEQQLIHQALLKSEIKRHNVQPTEAELAEAIANIESSLPEGMTLAQALEQQQMTRDDLIEGITGDLAMCQLLEQEIAEPHAATDAEVEAFYATNKERLGASESVRARHILIGFADQDTDEEKAEKKARAESVRQSLLDGGDFAAAAREHSSCPSSAKGGDLGSFERGRMVPAFERAAFSQAPAAIGSLVETQFGYHIIQVTEHTPSQVPSLQEAAPRIAGHLEEERRAKAFVRYVEKLKSEAEIVRS